MEDFKIYGLATFSLLFSSVQAFNPYLQFVVLIGTIFTLILKIIKQLNERKGGHK